MKLRSNSVSIVCFLFIGIWISMGITSPLISSDKPLIIKSEGEINFPIFTNSDRTDYKSKDADFSVWPPIPFSPSSLDLQNTGSRSPGAIQKTPAGIFKHRLGTDHLGRDVLAGLFNGANISMIIVAGSLTTTALLGISLGLLMGFYGDRGFKLPLINFIAVLSVLLVSVFHLGIEGDIFWSLAIWFLVIAILYITIASLLGKRVSKTINIPVDLIFSRFIEVFESIPKLLLLIAIFVGFLPSIEKVILLLAITSWPSITRIVRAETLRERQKQYITAGITLGFSDARLMFKHILPNISGPIITHLTFTAGAIILVESALSFLGLGVPPEIVTWGRMLAQAKTQLSAWWLVVFPGFFIFATVFSLNYLGRYLGERFRSESQQKLLL